MTIVVPIGDKYLSFKALDMAIELAKAMNLDIVVIHSLYGGNKTDIEEIKRGENLLNEAVERVKKENIRVKKRLLIRGKSAGQDIVDIANELNAKMIVMGCGVIENYQERLLGKTTEYVVLNAKQPLLLVK